MSIDSQFLQAEPVSAALHNRCPRCGHGRLFKGYIDLRPACQVCRLNYDFADSGDGPAVFMALFAGAIVVGLLLWTDATFELPMWIEMAIFLPMTLIVCLGALRPLKALLIGLQYRNKSGQGRLSS